MVGAEQVVTFLTHAGLRGFPDRLGSSGIHVEDTEIQVHANGFDEDLFQCEVCGSTWSVNHGLVEIVKDTQSTSILEANDESVDGVDNS